MDRKIEKTLTRLERLFFRINMMRANARGVLKNFTVFVETLPEFKAKGHFLLFLEDRLEIMDARQDYAEDFRLYLKDFIEKY